MATKQEPITLTQKVNIKMYVFNIISDHSNRVTQYRCCKICCKIIFQLSAAAVSSDYDIREIGRAHV